MSGFFVPGTPRRPVWLEQAGPSADVAVATRARLVRNLADVAFPHRASDAERATVLDDLLRRLARVPSFAEGWGLACAGLTAIERRVLAEKMLMPARLVEEPAGRGVVVAPDLGRTAVVNADDHLRLHAFRPGFAPREALAEVLALDAEVENEVEPAFSPEWGYLTASPTDLGTGLRLSALLHLPGLVLVGEIDKVLNALRQLQFGVRGQYGDGGSVRGSVFQVSSLVTLGRDEDEIAADFAVHVGKIITYERAARDQLHGRDPLGLEDMVHRSRAVAASARIITAQEAFDCLSNVRLGENLGLLPPSPTGLLNRLTVEHQAAHLEAHAGRTLAGRDRAAARGALLRAVFAAPDGIAG
ncbi:hypothetical protein KDM41_12700 [bacterium]|nr:hypothetical protein [bacterium]